MSRTAVFAYFVLTFACIESCEYSDDEETLSEKYVVTKKYLMPGEEFVRHYYEKSKILRITDDYRDWPLYNYWWDDDEHLSKISIEVSAGNEAKPAKMTLKEIKLSKTKDLFSNHHITEEQELLAESVLVPLTILSCRDLYRSLLDTAVFSLYFSQSSDSSAHDNLFENNTYALIIDGKWHVTLCPDCTPVTFSRGELIYVPPDAKMYKWHAEGSFLAAKLTWPRYKTSENKSAVKCMPLSLQSVDFREGWSRNTKPSARINGSRLNTGFEIPPIGFGTERLYGKTYDSVKHALKIGYRLIDTSKSYFGNDDKSVPSEIEIGRAITDSDIPRNEIMLSVKIPIDVIKENVVDLVQDSLKNLGGKYLDILILELPFRNTDDRISYTEKTQKIWTKLKSLQKNGIVRTLGICNVRDVEELDEILKFAGDSLSIIQNWLDLFRLEEDIRARCKELGIMYMGYGTMGYRRMDMEKSEESPVLTAPCVAENAREIDVPKGAFLLRWIMLKDVIVTPCSSDEYHIENNFYSTLFNIHEDNLVLLDERRTWKEILLEETKQEAVKDEL